MKYQVVPLVGPFWPMEGGEHMKAKQEVHATCSALTHLENMAMATPMMMAPFPSSSAFRRKCNNFPSIRLNTCGDKVGVFEAGPNFGGVVDTVGIAQRSRRFTDTFNTNSSSIDSGGDHDDKGTTNANKINTNINTTGGSSSNNNINNGNSSTPGDCRQLKVRHPLRKILSIIDMH